MEQVEMRGVRMLGRGMVCGVWCLHEIAQPRQS